MLATLSRPTADSLRELSEPNAENHLIKVECLGVIWTNKLSKTTHQDTQKYLWGISKNVNFKQFI